MTMFIWSSHDHALGRTWVDKIAALAPVAANTVTEVSLPAWVAQIDAFCPYGVHGGARVISLPSPLTPRTLTIIAAHFDSMPADPVTLLSAHALAAASPSCCNTAHAAESSFNPALRRAHLALEIFGTVLDKSKLVEAQAWAKGLYDELRASGEALDGAYVSIANPEDVTLETAYGSAGEGVVELWKKRDPEGVFRLAIPRVG